MKESGNFNQLQPEAIVPFSDDEPTPIGDSALEAVRAEHLEVVDRAQPVTYDENVKLAQPTAPPRLYLVRGEDNES